jgi:Co/Zn/Cd efflux system component
LTTKCNGACCFCNDGSQRGGHAGGTTMDHGHSHGGEAAAGLLAHDHIGDVPVKGAALAAGGSRGRAKASAMNKAARAKLLAAGGFCILFMIGEVIGGYLAGSLAIMTE